MTLAALAAAAYLIVLGGTPLGDESGLMLLVNIGIGVVAVALYALRVAPSADRTDGLALLAYLAFLAACLLSQFPRGSFDAALAALGMLAFFSLARRSPLVTPGGAGRWLLAWLGLILGIGFLALWAGVVLQWLAISETAPPILELRFPSLQFGHAHDVAVLLVLCAAAAVGLPGRRGRLLAVAVVAVVGAAVLTEGSRNAWLAVGVASALVGVAWAVRRGGVRPGRRAVALGLAVVVLGAVLLVVSGLGARLADSETVASRFHIWWAAVQAWLLDPFSGLGPGSFPWALQLTDWFSTPTFAPRHPDNAVVQSLTEAGLLGLAALGLAVAAVWVGRHRPIDRSALWALTFFGAACLLANPSDHGFLAIPAVGWAAAFSRRTAAAAAEPADTSPRNGIRWASALAGGAVAAMALVWAGIGFLHDQVPAEADPQALLTVAVRVDPGQPLYHRELGTWLLADGSPAAIPELLATVNRNPSDTAAWRLLAVALGLQGDLNGAGLAARMAVERMRADAANMWTLAWVKAAQGDARAARDLVGEAMLQAPWLTGDLPGPAVIPGVSATEGATAGIVTWLAIEDPPISTWIHPTWLVGFKGGDDLQPQAIQAAGKLDATASALHAFFTCRTDEALSILGGAGDEDGLAWYWRIRYLIESGISEPSLETATLGGLLTLSIVLAESSAPLPDTLSNHLHDAWGYGRRALPAPEIIGAAPSADAGFIEWLRDPLRAAGRTMPGHQCLTTSRP